MGIISKSFEGAGGTRLKYNFVQWSVNVSTGTFLNKETIRGIIVSKWYSRLGCRVQVPPSPVCQWVCPPRAHRSYATESTHLQLMYKGFSPSKKKKKKKCVGSRQFKTYQVSCCLLQAHSQNLFYGEGSDRV